MSNSAAVREWITATLRGVPGIGRVHGHERHAARESALRRFYQAGPEAGGALCGWFVRRTARSDEPVGGGGAMWRVHTTWMLRGYMALNDSARDDADASAASEGRFDALIDRIIARFRIETGNAEQRRLLARAGEDGGSPRLAEAGPVLFAGVLCHTARLELRTAHYEERNEERIKGQAQG